MDVFTVLIAALPQLVSVPGGPDGSGTPCDANVVLLLLDEATDNAAEYVQRLNESVAGVPIVVVSEEPAAQAGVDGVAACVLAYESSPAALVAALVDAANETVPRRRPESVPSNDPVALVMRSLTPREREVLQLVGQGLRNDAIAASLGISPETVRTHLQNLMAKLGTRSRAAVIAAARAAPSRQPVNHANNLGA